jgi:hypothetical protein
MKKRVNSARLPESAIVARLIHNFVVKHRQARYLALTEKPNPHGGYGFGELAHFTRNLDLRYCKQLPAGSQYDGYVLQEIAALTSSTECYIMHESAALDGQWMELEEALMKVLGQNMGAFLVVDNGDIMYYESETVKQRYIGVRRRGE